MIVKSRGDGRKRAVVWTLLASSTSAASLPITHLSAQHSNVAAAGEGVLLLLAAFFQFATLATFAFWLLRVYGGLEQMGIRTRYSAAAAVGFLYLPLVNFFLPQTLLHEIWTKAGNVAAQERTTAPPFDAWWFSLLASTVLSNFSAVFAIEAGADFQLAVTAFLVTAALLSALTTALGMKILTAVDGALTEAKRSLPPTVAGPAARRSLLRELALPIVDATETAGASADPPTLNRSPEADDKLERALDDFIEGIEVKAKRARTAAAMARSAMRLSSRDAPVHQPLTGVAALIANCTLGIQLLAAVQIYVCLFTMPRPTRGYSSLDLVVIYGFFNLGALLEYLVIFITWIACKRIPPALISSVNREKCRRAVRVARLSFIAVLVLSQVTGPRMTMRFLAAVQGAILFAAYVWREQLISSATSGVPIGETSKTDTRLPPAFR